MEGLMSRRARKSNNPLSGCAGGLLMAVLGFGVLIYGTNAPVANPGATIPMWLSLIIVISGIVFLIGILAKKIGLFGILIAFAVGVALIALNGTDHMPNGGPNPCPGDEIIIVVNGQCRGMDADANAEWLEGILLGGK